MWTLEWNEQSSSFYDYVATQYPQLLPGQQARSLVSPNAPHTGFTEGNQSLLNIPNGTTVLALRCRDGAVVAGDRLATEGFQVSLRRIEKVYKTDAHSVMAIAGAAGPCIEMARLLSTELEHYEKLEGEQLSTNGKANKLSQMIRGNFNLAMQGLLIIPIFVSYDPDQQAGRIFKYDITGGRYEEIEYHATGSGGKDARNTIKRLYRPDLETEEAVQIALEALFDASEEDRATAGPDPIRGIYPTVKTISRDGVNELPEEQIGGFYPPILERRKVA